METTTRLISMVFIILVGATAFGLAFRGFGGDTLILSAMGFDPLWYDVLLGINLQTSFLTPFGFALFYFRGVALSQVTTGQFYRGIIPFVTIPDHRAAARGVLP